MGLKVGAGLTRNPKANQGLKSLLFVNNPFCGGGNPYALPQSRKGNCIAKGENGFRPFPSFLTVPWGFPKFGSKAEIPWGQPTFKQ